MFKFFKKTKELSIAEECVNDLVSEINEAIIMSEKADDIFMKILKKDIKDQVDSGRASITVGTKGRNRAQCVRIIKLLKNEGYSAEAVDGMSLNLVIRW